MNVRSLTIITALALVLALPLAASAQDRDHGGDRGDSRHGQSDRGRGDDNSRQSDHGRASGRDSGDRQSNGRDSNSTRDGSNRRDQQDNRNWDSRPTRENRNNDNRDFGTRSDANRSHSSDNWARQDRPVDHARVFENGRPDVTDRTWNREPVSDWRRGDEHISVDYRNGHFFHNRPFVEYVGDRTDWNDIAVFCGFVGIMGYLEDDDFLYFAGTTGALYAMWRYDDDLACDDPYRHARACYFSLPFFYRDGVRFERRIVVRGGERYYQFCRA